MAENNNAPSASPAALTAGDQQTLKLIYDAMSMGTGARTLANLLACIENVKHHADCIDAVEREFFMVPGEPDEDDPDSEPGDECLLNRWGSTVEQYVEQFRSAIPHLLAASPAALMRDRMGLIAHAMIDAYKEHYDFPSQGESHMHDCIMGELESFAGLTAPAALTDERIVAMFREIAAERGATIVRDDGMTIAFARALLAASPAKENDK